MGWGPLPPCSPPPNTDVEGRPSSSACHPVHRNPCLACVQSLFHERFKRDNGVKVLRTIAIILEQNCAHQIVNHIHCFCRQDFFHQHFRTMSSIAPRTRRSSNGTWRNCSARNWRQGEFHRGRPGSTGATARTMDKRSSCPVRAVPGHLKRLDRLAQRREPDIARAGRLYRWGTIDLEQEGDMDDDIFRMGCFSTFQPLQPSIVFLRVACGGSFMMASPRPGPCLSLATTRLGSWPCLEANITLP